MEVASGVHRIAEADANWYVVDRGGSVVLIDCGWPRSRGALIKGLEAIGRSPADVRAVFLTHGHPDHLGTARWLHDEHGVPTFAAAAELPRVHGQRPPRPRARLLVDGLRPHALRFVPVALGRGQLATSWPVAARALDDAPAAGLTAVPTPGHTEGHVAYHLADRGVVFSGDALVTLDVLSGRRGPRLHALAFAADPRAARQSLAALAGLDAQVLLPGHGAPYHGRLDVAAERALRA